MIDFLVSRDDLRLIEVTEAPEPEPVPGEVLLRVDKFGFSANNITYAALGEAMRYWDFFPAPSGWGRIPVWGYADVERSRHEAIQEGQRAFGYLPMSTHAVLQPDRVTEAGFVDAAPHRADLPGVYQRYSLVTQPEDEDQEALWRPLFMTSFGAADFFAERDLFGARAVVFSSASSKTALGTAFLLSRSREGDLIGLSSPGNVEFCERLDYYDEVLAYERLDELSREQPTLFVDFAGNERLLHRLRVHLGPSLTETCVIGATQWEERDAGSELGGAGAQFFFLPPWIERRRRDWGPGEFGRRYAAAWSGFLPSARSWLRIVHDAGPEAVEAVYRELLDGRSDPSVGHILSLHGQD
jgi:hypothetical protein